MLDNTLLQESFTGTSSLAHCSLIYEFLIDDGTGTYVPYTDTHISVDTATQMVNAQSTDNTLDQTTNKMKIRAAVTDSAASTSSYSELTFEIYWSSVCWFVVPTIDGPYPDLETQVFGPTVTASAPIMVNDPYPGTDCGLYDFTLIWPVQDRAKRFLTWSPTYDVSVTSNEVLDAGTYGFTVRMQLVNYPTVTASTGFKVIIAACTIGSITPPTTPITEIIHVVGTSQSSRSFSDFTQSPACEINLSYTVLDSLGNTIDSEFEIDVVTSSTSSLNLLLVGTQNASLVGTHEL